MITHIEMIRISQLGTLDASILKAKQKVVSSPPMVRLGRYNVASLCEWSLIPLLSYRRRYPIPQAISFKKI
jgi:hypothetical protein